MILSAFSFTALVVKAKELGVAEPQIAKQSLQPILDLPLTGNYCVTKGGLSLHDPPHTGQFSIDVPGTPIRAYWFWTGRSVNSPVGDDTIALSIENASGTQEAEIQAQAAHSANDRIYTWHANTFRDDELAYVASGLNRYTISGFTIDNDAKYNHGVATLVIYESDACPYARINGWSGLDSFHWSRKGELGPDSNIMCDVFPSSVMTRTLSASFAIGGVASADRGNSIWYITGNGEQPSFVAPKANGDVNPIAVEIFDPLNGDPGHEWDLNSTDLTIPAGDTYVCLQIESPEDDDGISSVWAGLITAMPLDPPAVAIQKTANSPVIQRGGAVTFTINVTNTGAITLTNVSVMDQLTPSCERDFSLLAPGSTEMYSCTMMNIMEPYTNVVEVIGLTPDGFAVRDHDTASVSVSVPPSPTPPSTPPPTPTPTLLPTFTSTPLPSPTATLIPSPTTTPVTTPVTIPTPSPTATPLFFPALSLEKQSAHQKIQAGGNVTFTFRVENTGDLPLTNVTITDSLAPQCDRVFTSLVVGQSEEYDCVMTNIQKSFVNVAIVTAEVPGGLTISISDDAEVTVEDLIPTPIMPEPIEVGAIGDRVWLDQNINGLQDEGEQGLSGIEVSLYLDTGEVISKTVTDGEGNYLFTGLRPNTYVVEFIPPNGLNLTENNQGNGALDSDPDPSTGQTIPIELSTGMQNLTIDAGLVGTPALFLSKEDAGAVAQPGGIIVYTLVVTNTGNTTALDVVIVEFMPENTSFYVDESAEGWVCETLAPRDTQCTLGVGDLAPQETFQTTFAVKVNTPLPLSVTVINNQATINSTNGISGKQAVTEITPLAPTYLLEGEEPLDVEYLYIPLVR